MEDIVQYIEQAADPSVPDAERCRAFGALVDRFQDMAFGYALGLLGDRYQAEDAAQEGFITAWEHLGSLRTPAAFPGWFRRIVQWQCQRFRRVYRPVFVSLPEDMPSLGMDPAMQAEQNDSIRMVHLAIDTLPETLRDVTLLHYTGDYSQREIASFLNLSVGTVKKRLFDARRKLKTSLLDILADDLHEQAPSHNQTFGDKVMKWIRPDFSTEQGDFADGRSEQVWEMLLAAVEGDVKKTRKLLKEDAALANCSWAYYSPINFAVREGHTAVVKLLLDHGADPTTSSGLDYQAPPLERARDRGLNEIVDLLNAAIEKRYQAPPVGQAVCEAVQEGDISKVTGLLDARADLVNASDDNGNRPLHLAVEENNLALTTLLLDQGADLDARRGDGCKPLHIAVYRGRTYHWSARPNPLLTGYLLARGADYSMTVAAALGDERRVRELLARDKKLANDQDTCKCSPLFSAARGGHAAIVKLLLDHGADPNASECDAPRGHALYQAAAGNHLEIAQMLLDHGADPNAPVESGGNPLTQALGRRKNGELVHLLYRHGASANITMYILLDDIPVVGELLAADPNLANYGGDYGALCMAAGFARIEIIEMLIRVGADLNRPWYANNYMGYAFNRYKGWALDGAQLRPHTDKIEVLNLFFDHGADPNNANWHGVTYLHKLAARGDVEKAVVVLDRGAHIDAIDDEWRSTPLGWAARAGQRAMVEYLLDRGADRDAAGASWATPLARAEKAGHGDIVDVLRRAGDTG